MLCNVNRLGSRKILGQEQRSLRKLSGARNKVEYFLTRIEGANRFNGFGPKYARNFWLDYADDDAINSAEHFGRDFVNIRMYLKVAGESSIADICFLALGLFASSDNDRSR